MTGLPLLREFLPGALIGWREGRPVTVARPLGESYTGKDTQLDAAVRELLKLVPARTAER